MGLLYYAIKIPKVITVTFFLNIFSHARFVFVGAITRLGLYKPTSEEEEEEEEEENNNSNNYILILDGSSPSLVPIPVHVVTAAIKNRVPIVQYRDFFLLRHQQQQQEQKVIECTICLELIEWTDKIRELCNCSHVFHRECLDTWIEEGQVTCPLCRSMMLPPKTNLLICHNPQNLN